MINGKTFIGEIKLESPFGFKSPYSFNYLMDLCNRSPFIDWISIHTNILWHGDMESISYARMCTDKPILAKGIHATDKMAREAINRGANYVLIYNRVPDPNDIHLDRCLLEINSPKLIQELKENRPFNEYDLKFVHNARDLKTGLMKPKESLDEFLKLEVETYQASGIKTIQDVNPNVKGFIVGEHLVDFIQTL